MARDRREMATDRAQLVGDVADVRRLERLVAELDRARTAGNKAQEQEVQVRIAAALRQEAAEGRRDARQDTRETGAARREVRRDAPGAGRRDDRRDVRDDRRDAAASRQRADRQQAIMNELRSIQLNVAAGKADAVARQRALLDEFLTVAKADAKATGRELGEDRRETREDVRRP
ncbi:MAG: hypothetical protein EXR93_08255 [Gemmatimonadetes bacterium]|nr:hypothetical protein [Gemmatimonadota bacterium]